MTDSIRVLIVDDIAETRDHISKLLSFETDMNVVGTAASGPEALTMAPELQPDVVLMDINMPGMDGIATTEQMATRAPGASIVMMSVQGEADYLRRSMLAGAREFLVKPFSSDELCDSIRNVYTREREKQTVIAPMLPAVVKQPSAGGEPGQIISVFSPKGGVGRTTLAVNLAVAMAEQGSSVALMDASFQFGDVGVLMNMNPKNKSIADVLADVNNGDTDALDSVLVKHTTGVDVLLAPPSPEVAELITPDQVRAIVRRLADTHQHVVIDCWPLFQDPTLGLLDQSTLILVLVTLEITNIKNIRLFLGLADQLGYSDKLRLVLNRADSAYGIRVSDIEHSIGRKVDHTVVSDGRTVVYALNRGVPFVWSNKQAQVSQDVLGIARAIAGDAAVVATPERAQAPRKLFAWR
jgi:pilus assembly protein CpaE